MKLRQIFEAAGKTAAIAFGRMNPPTIGHEKLVNVIASQKADPFLFITQTQKPKTDPLPFNIKLQFAQAAFPQVTVGDENVKTIIQALQKVESMGYENLIYVAGSDRVESFNELLNNYNGKDYTFKSIKVVSAGERDPDAEGAEGMSASKMREAAMKGNFEAFAQGLPKPLQNNAKNVYSAVRTGMGIKELEPSEDVGEGWKSTVAGAALAGAAALGGTGAHAQASGEDFLPDIVAHVTFRVDGKEVTKDINLGTQFKSPGQASEALEKFLKSKGIKYFNYSLERVKPKDNDYLDKKPYTSSGADSGSDYMDKKPAVGSKSKDNYMSKEGISEVSEYNKFRVGQHAKFKSSNGTEFDVIVIAVDYDDDAVKVRNAANKPFPNGELELEVDPGWKFLTPKPRVDPDSIIAVSPSMRKTTERVRDPEDWDEGNTEPPNNFAVYINGKKWKVFKGRGYYADDERERAHYYQLKDWARKKSEATGKKWEVSITGEPATESIEESNYGKYWCSTDKKWKYRKGPKQKRSS